MVNDKCVNYVIEKAAEDPLAQSDFIDEVYRQLYVRMMPMRVKLDVGAFMPMRAHEADGGYDLYSPVDATVYDLKGTEIDTGVHVQIPRGFVGFIKSRSGMNIKKNVVCEGVIDSGYTGSIAVKLRLQSGNVYDRVVINRGDRIAQLVLLPVFTPELEEVDELEETERGDNGFGSSGR